MALFSKEAPTPIGALALDGETVEVDSDCVVTPRPLVDGLAIDADGGVYFANETGLYSLDVANAQAELIVATCDLAGSVRVSVARNGSVAYLVDSDRLLRIDLDAGSSEVVMVNGGPIVGDERITGDLVDVAIDPSSGSVLVASHQSCVFTVAMDGVAEVYAGDCAVSGSAGDGKPPLEALFGGVTSVDIDSVGNVFIADHGKGMLRVVPSDAGAIISDR